VNRRFQFHKRGQLFICVHDKTLSVVAMRVRIQIVLPSESPAEIQPRLQPALLSLSAMISQYFTDDRYRPFAAALSPSFIASASLTYLPFLVVP
jgi:hypothetical protein